MTGMFYDPTLHRIYYTVSGDTRLFLPLLHTGERRGRSRDVPGRRRRDQLQHCRGHDPRLGPGLLGSSSDGALRSAPFSGGRVTGAAAVVSGDGAWRFRAIMVPNT